MIKLYKDQKHTLYQIQKAINVSSKTLYRYANKERDIDNMPVDILLKIAKFENIEPNELYNKMLVYRVRGDK